MNAEELAGYETALREVVVLWIGAALETVMFDAYAEYDPANCRNEAMHWLNSALVECTAATQAWQGYYGAAAILRARGEI